MSLYLIGYFITFVILATCVCYPDELEVLRGKHRNWLDDMGFTKPFNCCKGNLIFAAIQALWWPWPFIWLVILLILLPFILIYTFIKEK
jgi:hypothetical protein